MKQIKIRGDKLDCKDRRLKVLVNRGRKSSDYDLDWSEKEEKELCKRILSLRDDQIAALSAILVGFDYKVVENVTEEIRKNGINSGHLPILIYEAKSKEILMWWLEYFDRLNSD